MGAGDEVRGLVLTAHMSGHIRAWQAVAPQLLFEWEAHRVAVESVVLFCAAVTRRSDVTSGGK
jgi:hypothetical protein